MAVKSLVTRSIIEEAVLSLSQVTKLSLLLLGGTNFAMGSPEDKVNFLDDDLKTLPSTTALEEFEEDSNCPLTCLALAFLVIFGVFFGLVVFPSPRHGSYNEQGVFTCISQNSFFSFHLP